MTNTQQQQQINEAAEQLADAVKESYQTVADRTVSAQELNAQLSENFFNQVINNLHTQADQNREMTQKLADQQQRGVEAAQQLTQESVGAYMDFLNSTFSFAQGGIQAEQRGAEEASGAARAAGAVLDDEEMKAEGHTERGEGPAEGQGNREYFRKLIEETNRRAAGKA